MNNVIEAEKSQEFEEVSVMKMKPLWLSYNTVCELLCLERNGLRSLMRREKLFPKAFKLGTSRQAAVYFDREEIETWYQDFKERYRGEK